QPLAKHPRPDERTRPQALWRQQQRRRWPSRRWPAWWWPALRRDQRRKPRFHARCRELGLAGPVPGRNTLEREPTPDPHAGLRWWLQQPNHPDAPVIPEATRNQPSSVIPLLVIEGATGAPDSGRFHGKRTVSVA